MRVRKPAPCQRAGFEMNFTEQYAHIVLRVGAAFAFVYPPIKALVDPITWLGYIPSFVRTLPVQLGLPIDSLVLLHAFGIVEIALALWLLFGKNVRVPATLMTLILLAIVTFNSDDFDVLFRDLSIAAMTLALAFWPNPYKRSDTSASVPPLRLPSPRAGQGGRE